MSYISVIPQSDTVSEDKGEFIKEPPSISLKILIEGSYLSRKKVEISLFSFVVLFQKKFVDCFLQLVFGQSPLRDSRFFFHRNQ